MELDKLNARDYMREIGKRGGKAGTAAQQAARETALNRKGAIVSESTRQKLRDAQTARRERERLAREEGSVSNV